MAKGKRTAHRRLDPFYIGIIIFIVIVLLAVAGGVILAGGFPKNNGEAASSGNLSSAEETSSWGEASSMVPEDGASSDNSETGKDSESQGGNTASGAGQAAFEEQFGKNAYDAGFEEKMNQAANNAQILEVYNEYINLWKAEITNVMEQLSDALDEPQYQEVQAEQGQWDGAIDAQLEEQFAEIDKTGQGSAANISKAEITYQAYRDRAKELYRILYEVEPDFTVGKE